MKTLLRFALIPLAFLTANVLSAEVITLKSGSSYQVPPGKVAEIVSLMSDDGAVAMTIDGLSVNVPTATATGTVAVLPIYIAEGHTIVLTSGTKDIVTLKEDDAYLYEKEATTTTPSNAVVIPTSSTGNYDVVLEGSADMVSWTPITPGTYDASSTTLRFFRVRVDKL
ncbi:MAG: hypothetical protein Q7Q73_16595 [Verrucomicrobiota bacterium JB024]|nr:hypothetical protein [Verrucomicrobiota bacterium JB024]